MDETIQTEWKIELDYLKSYDQIRKGMREIVDLPEKRRISLSFLSEIIMECCLRPSAINFPS